MSDVCYHCGEVVPSGTDYHVTVDGTAKAMCCRGCQAVAQLILTAGLDDYYRLRSSTAVTPSEDSDDYRRFDYSELIEEFSHRDGDNWVSRFSVSGLRCAACAWLIEHHLQKVEGIESVTVHLQNAVATVKWNPKALLVSQIFHLFSNLGYQALPWSASNRDKQLHDEMDGLLRRLGVAGIGMMQAGMVAIGLYAGDFQGIDDGTRTLLRVFSLLITTPVLLYSAQPFFKNAWRSLRRLHPGMDVPVSIALIAAYIASFSATLLQSDHVYFDTISMFTFFLLLSRYLQLRVAQHQHSASSLPMSARKIKHIGSSEFEWTPVKSLAVGELINIRPGETIPADGIIRRGQSSLESSAFNGEFLPTRCVPGDTAMAGCGNVDGNIDIEITAVSSHTAWAKINQLLEQAQAAKPAVAQLADRMASHFVILVMLVSGLSFVYWSSQDSNSAFLIALSILVVSCPCALSLATPASYTAAIKALGKQGVLLSNGRILEQMRNVSHVVFDKTGTLTEGRPHILSCRLLGNIDEQTALNIAGSLEAQSLHPISHAFKQEHRNTLSPENIEIVSGAGIKGLINGKEYRIGTAAFCGIDAPTNSPNLNVFMSDNTSPLAHFYLADEIRGDAPTLLHTLRTLGLKTEVLSGDSSNQVAEVSTALGIQDFYAACSAEQKLAHVKHLQAQGATVMMVGDGINDAPVIAAADISVAMTTASQLTRTQADVVLLDNNLSRIVTLFDKAKQSRRVLIQNLSWALGYNLLGLPLAAMGLVPPWLAALGMSLSSLLVVFNALRLNRTPKDHWLASTSPASQARDELVINGGSNG